MTSESGLLKRFRSVILWILLQMAFIARQIYHDWRLRGRIEHGYRFDEKQGLAVEDLRVRTLERMRRLFALVLLAAQFIFHLSQQRPPQAALWLRKLGGKFGLTSDRDGPYILLRGLSALLQTIAKVTWSDIQPFPHHLFPCKATYG